MLISRPSNSTLRLDDRRPGAANTGATPLCRERPGCVPGGSLPIICAERPASLCFFHASISEVSPSSWSELGAAYPCISPHRSRPRMSQSLSRYTLDPRACWFIYVAFFHHTKLKCPTCPFYSPPPSPLLTTLELLYGYDQVRPTRI